jgi:hypothetical protein
MYGQTNERKVLINKRRNILGERYGWLYKIWMHGCCSLAAIQWSTLAYIYLLCTYLEYTERRPRINISFTCLVYILFLSKN